MAAELMKVHSAHDDRGALGVVDGAQLPFEIKRIYFLHDVPAGKSRGAHGHVRLQQFIVCLSGSVDVVIDDGETSQTFALTTAETGLLVPAMHWRELRRFSIGAVVLVLASRPYEPEDYIHDHVEFLKLVRAA